MSYFPEPYTRSKNKTKAELDFSNYATKSDLKSAIGADLSESAKEADLADLKPDIHKLDFGKLETTPDDLSKLTNVVKNEVYDKVMHNKIIR